MTDTDDLPEAGVIHSPALGGEFPCVRVGVNGSHSLIEIEGMVRRMAVPSSMFFPGVKPRRVREIQTTGGTITLEGSKIVSAWCSRCCRGGLPSKRGGGAWACICGNVVAEVGDLPEEV